MKTLKTINLSQKIEPDLSEKLISLARSRKVSKSRLVRQAIADLVEKYNNQKPSEVA